MTNSLKPSKTLVEEIELAGHELMDSIRDLIEQGNVRHHAGEGQLQELAALPGVVAVGGVFALAAPVMAALGAFAALAAKVRLEIERSPLPSGRARSVRQAAHR